MFCHVMMILLSAFVAAPHSQADGPMAGNWKVIYTSNPMTDTVDCIVKLEKNDGKWEGTVVAAPAGAVEPSVESVSLNDGILRVVLKKGAQQFVVEAIAGADSKKMLASWGNDRVLFPGAMIWTEDDTITGRGAMQKQQPPPMKKIIEMNRDVQQARTAATRATDADEKKKLTEEAAEKQKELDAELPKLYRQVIAEHAGTDAAFDSGMTLLRAAKKYQLSAADAKDIAEAALKSAKTHGPRLHQDTLVNIAEAIVNTNGMQPLAADLARQAEKALGAKATPQQQVRALMVLVAALSKSNPSEARPLAQKLEALESKLDAEFIAKQPKLKFEPFAGRQDGGNQVVLFELFTGAECPPCVAADVAFDKLIDTFKPSEVVLLQYHEHIPRPDALTNSDSEARFKWYNKAFPGQVRGTPSVIINGKPSAGGGGAITAAGATYEKFREAIEPLLKEKAKANLSLTATQDGDTVTLTAKVADLDQPLDDLKWKFALFEDVVRYPGGNGLRLHHHVVRAMPGGVEGQPINAKNETMQVTLQIPELRGRTVKYLEDTIAARGPFPRAYRPMEFRKLKAAAWIQDDKSHAVLQAAQASLRERAVGE